MATVTRRAAPKTEPSTEAPADPPEGKSEELPPEQEERIVSKVINAVKGEISKLAGSPPKTGEGEGDPEEGDPDGPVTTPPPPAQVEAQSEHDVRAAVKAILGEEQHEKEHEHLKAVVEKPPQVVSRLTKLFWGEPD